MNPYKYPTYKGWPLLFINKAQWKAFEKAEYDMSYFSLIEPFPTQIFKCDECGQFISMLDLIKGNATNKQDTPDSYYSKETYIRLCKTCTLREKENEPL